MEAKAKDGFKERLLKAKKKKELLKLIFQYPASKNAVVKRGVVLECFDKEFNFDEKYDGETTYSYNYLVEVRPIELKGGSEANEKRI